MFTKPNQLIKIKSIIFILFLISASASKAGVTISQFPLITSGGAADNLVLIPSVEWPTVNSFANIGEYNNNTYYGGYFDSNKCYEYSYNANEKERHFYPVDEANNYACPGDNEWSGNFLNWATTQTIDSFRYALTGGYRVKDTTTETWLEKAHNDGQAGLSNRSLPSSGNNYQLVRQLTPFITVKSQNTQYGTTSQVNYITTNISGYSVNNINYGNRLRFALNNKSLSTSTVSYQPNTTLFANVTYELSVRVKVCDASFLETNCEKYGSNYKPEGVLQEYANRLRYSAFGYLNHSVTQRDGAVLRAQQKSIGPYLANLTNDEIRVENPDKEWDPNTGILYRNPSPVDANETYQDFGINVQDSGVINYINKFGQMMTDNAGYKHKSYDPVSEMYYAGLRYLRNLGNVPSYTNMSGLNATTKMQYADGFPVLTDWHDPYQAACQASAFLGIGDVNSHRDKNLPGNTEYRQDEPAMPPEVSQDTINVVQLTNKVGQLEGIGNIGSVQQYTGRYNSAYIAGMAWYANTYDIRPDWAGKQTVATFWVDVLEGQSLADLRNNQYALAAKYGGFRVGEGFDPESYNESLPESWWHTNNDTLKPNFLRPDNYFTAGQSSQIVSSIKQVFARIIARVNGTGAGLASNSTKLISGSKIFQSVFFNKSWHGELKAFSVDTQTGQLYPSPDWLASDQLPAWNQRKIYSGNSLFTWSNLSNTQKNALVSEDVVNYLRGDASKEQRNGGNFRDRYITPLGDIVHSQPVLVGRPDAKLYAGHTFSGADVYATFANNNAQRKAVLYVGSNDGMLHAFEADTGKETYAFVPNAVIFNNLKNLADPNYQHQYYVDGELTVADVYLDNAWKTILVGTLGAGGKAIFALDVTDPSNVKFLWEKDHNNIPALGNIIGKPVITQTANGEWQVLVANGPNSAADKAQLVMINLKTGAVDTIDTGVANNNGLTGITAWSEFANSISNIFYGGDMNGNIWKFTLDQPAQKLFTARSAQDKKQVVSAAPLPGIDPSTGKFWLFFGTGQYLSQLDLTDNSPQSWYGIIPKTDGQVTRADLLERSILIENTNGNYSVRVSSLGTADELVDKSGWYFDLPASGERMVIPNIFQGNVLIGTVRIPDASDICKPTGRGFIIALSPFTGGRLDRIFFDVNGDGKFDDNDNTMYNGESTIISGIGFDSSPNAPIFIGNVMQVVKDDGVILSILTQGRAPDMARTSWHEIINQQ